MAENPLAALAATHPDLEVWFDSSPLILASWKAEVLAKVAATAAEARCEERLDGVWDTLVGCTTNPPLTAQVVEYDPKAWGLQVDELIRKAPGASDAEVMWQLYTGVVRAGAERFLPVFESSMKRLGYLSGQVDPRILDDTGKMVAQAVALHAVSPNVMVKMPGVREGILGITLLTALGIPTNATLVFTTSQILAVAEAVRAGLEIARCNEVDLSGWRSVCTMMLGRFEDNPAFDESAASVGVAIDQELRRWAGIAIFNQAVRLYASRGYESKMLAASMRVGPVSDGRTRVWHLEKICGQPIVMTIFPSVIEAWLEHYDGEELPIGPARVPSEALDTLTRVPYFREGYEEGQPAGGFADHPAVLATGASFAEATDGLQAWVRDRMAALR